MAKLFNVPIATGGQFSCSSPADRVYLVEFNSAPDNRLTSAFNEAFLIILDLIETKLPKGVVITTSAIDKFYSNGLELGDLSDPGGRSTFFAHSLFPLLARLLSFPMPTVALLNGHTFAGGLIVAMHHDYRIQNPTKGFLCMNEVLFGANMDPALLGIFRAKVPSPATYRSLILEGHRFTAQQALQEGLVDGLGGRDEVLKYIQDRDLTKKGQSGVYGGLKEEMYREQLTLLASTESSAEWSAAMAARLQNRRNDMDRRLEGWKGKLSGSKL